MDKVGLTWVKLDNTPLFNGFLILAKIFVGRKNIDWEQTFLLIVYPMLESRFIRVENRISQR